MAQGRLPEPRPIETGRKWAHTLDTIVLEETSRSGHSSRDESEWFVLSMIFIRMVILNPARRMRMSRRGGEVRVA